MTNSIRPFGIRDKVGYMMGDFGCNMSFQLIASYLMLFMTQGMGLKMAHWAIIVIVTKIFDAINDPIIGALVDARKPTRLGKFRPWILWGAVGIAITTTLLFVDVRGWAYWLRFAYALVMYMVWSIAYTTANVPYGSLNAVLTDDSGQRASLSSLRSIGAGLATLPIMIVLPLLIYGEKDQNGYAPIRPEMFFWIALACGIVGILGFLVTFFCTQERAEDTRVNEKFNYFKTLKGFFKNRAVLAICLASFAQLVFIMSYATTLPLVFQFYFMSTEIISVASLMTMIPMMLLIPFMAKLAVKFGKKEISTWPNILAIAVLVAMLFINFQRNRAGAWLYVGMLAVAMFAGGTFSLATWSMVADCVDQQEIITGKREEASVYATYSLARKVAQGVGASVIALFLGMVGYNVDNVSVNTQPEIATGIFKLSIIFPLVGFVIIFITLLFMYNLNKNKVEHNTKILREIHHAKKTVKVISQIFYDIDDQIQINESFESALLNESSRDSIIIDSRLKENEKE